jgi:hypothetical protein
LAGSEAFAVEFSGGRSLAPFDGSEGLPGGPDAE